MYLHDKLRIEERCLPIFVGTKEVPWLSTIFPAQNGEQPSQRILVNKALLRPHILQTSPSQNVNNQCVFLRGLYIKDRSWSQDMKAASRRQDPRLEVDDVVTAE